MSQGPAYTITNNTSYGANKSPGYPAILYASIASWLQCLLGDSGMRVSVRGIGDRLKMKMAFEIARVVYLLYHDISNMHIHIILTCVYYQAGTTSYEEAKSKLLSKQNQWDNAALYGKVKERVFRVVFAYGLNEFKQLSDKERYKIWTDMFDENPEDASYQLFDHVITVLDCERVFDREFQKSLTSNDKDKLYKVRVMLRTKYAFACEQIYRCLILESPGHLAGGKRKYDDDEVEVSDKLYVSWAAYGKNPSVMPTIVALKDLPVVPPDVSKFVKKNATEMREARRVGTDAHIEVEAWAPY